MWTDGVLFSTFGSDITSWWQFKMDKIILIILLAISTNVICQSGLSYPYYLTSQNDNFYLKSIPFGSQMYSIPGRTDIFKASDSTLVYSISRYFDPNGIVLSNDGHAILYARYSIHNYDDFDEEIILYYQNGFLKKTYKVDELVQRNLDDYQYSLFYRDWDAFERKDGERVFADSLPSYKRKLVESPLFTNGLNAFLATKDHELIQFSLDDGKIESRQDIAAASDVIDRQFNSPKLIKPEFETPGVFHMPKLSNGEAYQKSFEKEFNYKYDGIVGNDKFKYYRLELTCLIDFNGNCIEAYSDFEDSTLNRTIEEFFLNQTFDSTAVPEITERWYFSHSTSFRKADSTTAINERTAEKEEERLHRLWRIKQDTLDGVYIPKDLEDCFKELERIMTENNKEGFRKSSPISYHMGLGRNMRNRWGLWSSSRLREYFLDLGVTHPDDMSGIILDSYHRYLNGKEIDLDKQLSRYHLTPRPKLKIPKDYKQEEK